MTPKEFEEALIRQREEASVNESPIDCNNVQEVYQTYLYHFCAKPSKDNLKNGICKMSCGNRPGGVDVTKRRVSDCLIYRRLIDCGAKEPLKEIDESTINSEQ